MYELDKTIRHIVIPWKNIFMGLSTRQFGLIYDVLEFPFNPPEDLRQIAHDFAFTLTLLHNNSEYATSIEALLGGGEVASIDLLEGTSPDDPYENRRDALFANAFAHLERLGYAEAVHQWGTHTDTYYKYSDRPYFMRLNALNRLCHLLRVWAVFEWLKNPVTTGAADVSSWEAVLSHYVPIYTREASPRFLKPSIEPLVLSAVTVPVLQEIIFSHEAKRLKLRTTLDEMEKAPKTPWEDFALRASVASARFSLEGDTKINLSEWNAIVRELSTEDLHLLEQWAVRDAGYARCLQRIPDFGGISVTRPFDFIEANRGS